MMIEIVTDLSWPSFRNVALHVGKAIKNRCDYAILDQTRIKPADSILFVGTVLRENLNLLKDHVSRSRIVFYGTTEGHSRVDQESLKVAGQVRIVAVSNFVRQMLEEIGIFAAGVVHHGLDMSNRRVDPGFYAFLEKKLRGRKIIFTASANHSRKGLDSLLHGYQLVEKETEGAYLILHSESMGYYNIMKIARDLKLKHFWLTNLYGKLSEGKMNAFYKLCSVYVQPSYSEGFGLPILEAFRFGKPAIAVDAPPFNEIIIQRQTGILVPRSRITWFNFADKVVFKMHMYDIGDLAQTMLELITDQEQAVEMHRNIERQRSSWSADALYPKLLDYFK